MRVVSQNIHADQPTQKSPLGVITNQVKSSPCLTRKWKKLAREPGKTKKKGKAVSGKRRMSIDFEEQNGGKKYYMDIGS